MELEFRTAKAEGILATVSNKDGRHAVTLQLHMGQVRGFLFQVLYVSQKLIPRFCSMSLSLYTVCCSNFQINNYRYKE